MSQGPQPELFVDGLLDVSFARGIVRVDLYSLSASEKLPSGQPRPEQRQRLVMSVPSFMELVSALQQASQSLREKGAFAVPAAAAAPAPEVPVAPAPVRKAPRSPNFAIATGDPVGSED